MTVLLVALGGGLGASLRFVLAHYLDRQHLDNQWPTGTLVVNVLGSFLLGLFVALSLSGTWLALLGTGFCGGLTTYSAFAVQTVGLGRRRGTAYALVTVAAGLAAAYAGFSLGSAR